MIKSVLGRDLIFISQIDRDGSGTTPVDEKYVEMMKEDKFTVTRLSLSENTFIAHGFNSFVVKVKETLPTSHKIKISVKEDGVVTKRTFIGKNSLEVYNETIEFLTKERDKVFKGL